MKCISLKLSIKVFQILFFYSLLLIYRFQVNAHQSPIDKRKDDSINEGAFNDTRTLLDIALKGVESQDTSHLRQNTADLGHTLFHLGKYQESIA